MLLKQCIYCVKIRYEFHLGLRYDLSFWFSNILLLTNVNESKPSKLMDSLKENDMHLH